jgi:deoxyribonuclease V
VHIHRLHSWNLTPTEAVALQRKLAAAVINTRPLPRWKLIAGADVSYNRFSSTIHAGVVVLRLPELTIVEKQGATGETTFPYVPGLLSFREAPIVLKAFARVKAEPDVVMLDGQGFAHPRRMGFASHVGLWLDRPCIGCAKSRLTGHFDPVGREAGCTSPLVDRGELIGEVVRTKTDVQPLYVSVGHKIDLASAVAVVLASCHRYRIPEPTRQAHLHVNEIRREQTH